MKRSTLVVVAIVLLAVVAFYFLRGGGGGGRPAVRLLDQFSTAERRTNAENPAEAIRLVQPTIDGQQRQALFMHPTSRVTFKGVRVPDDGQLRTAVAILPDAWSKGGDGVLFRLGVSDGRSYDELFKQHVDPANNRADQRWIPVEIDLSAYAGQQVDIILNTNSSLPGRGDDTRFDWAVWAAPEIFVR